MDLRHRPYLGGVQLVVLAERLVCLHGHEPLDGEVHAQAVHAHEEQLQEGLADALHHELRRMKKREQVCLVQEARVQKEPNAC